MKKIFLYSVMALFMCLFAACSQEEIVSEGGQGNNKVSLSVKVPGVGPVGRAADLTVDGYTMQCIMELVDADGNLLSGTSQMKTTVSNGTASFEFDKPSGEYTCLFWAEYLKDGESFYKTSGGLKAVAYDGNKKNELFNNKAADAFCGKITSTAITTGTNVTLKRPFARIAIAKEDFNTLGTDLNQCTVSIFSGTDFNVLSGKAGGTVNIKNTEAESIVTPITIDATSEYPFYCYVFSGDAIAKASSITFTKDGESASKKTLSITVEQMKGMGNNTAVNLKPETETGGGDDSKINVDITIDNGFGNGGNTPTEPENPAGTLTVGNYIYADGTSGTDATNAVAIVFALADAKGDDTPAAYGSSYGGKTIKAYAVAMENAGNRAVMKDPNIAFPTLTATTNTTTFAGFTTTAELNTMLGEYASPAFANYKAWVAAKTLTGANLSPWYIPSFKQLDKFGQMIFGEAPDATFASKVKGTFDTGGSKWFFLSSSVNSGLKFSAATIQTGNSESYTTGSADPTGTASACIRPILTIFE